MENLKSLENVKFVNQAQVSKHLECPICSNFLHNPLRLTCGHTFCQSCFEGLKASIQHNQNLRCAICREGIDLRNISPDKIAKNLLEEQIVYCLNRKNSCLWQGPLSQLSEHLDNCTFKEHDEISQNLINQFDEKVQQTAKNSDLNTVIQNQTFFDDKFQENYNKNVGGQLMARLLNKDKNLGLQIGKQNFLKFYSIKDSKKTLKNFMKNSNGIQIISSLQKFQIKLDNILQFYIKLHLFSKQQQQRLQAQKKTLDNLGIIQRNLLMKNRMQTNHMIQKDLKNSKKNKKKMSTILIQTIQMMFSKCFQMKKVIPKTSQIHKQPKTMKIMKKNKIKSKKEEKNKKVIVEVMRNICLSKKEKGEIKRGKMWEIPQKNYNCNNNYSFMNYMEQIQMIQIESQIKTNQITNK
ncbi:zinc finger, C3HC4 type (RING finger) protein (macronuclear) [Tetrahymena thermophila SB210]|uniref:Zinc finger, C3HC4 type (RING finger) protein n=1 Tax=Tetrahymena thermophila (strain SB210) TaxID=312017 RepID=I7MEF6_TETTS|nr:zinc finger, C3HC4 type (RING finger) protein [Tetrahymena thermophila SB210]EAR96265.2 zinc finger, C3HC4 type (RING finger) protein [Tetrahymena thermophila SB210]|eukprot:XP_001016510.2 zinc finger, C3HC4 type (RING finger) protein [Tetrahymena thermophila SB210]